MRKVVNVSEAMSGSGPEFEPGLVVMPGQAARAVEVGTVLSFGRGAPGRPTDLQVSGSPKVSRQAGTVEATPYGMLVSNTGSNPIFVRLGEGPTAVSLRPGQAYLVTTGRARVTFPGVSDYFEVEVAGADPVRPAGTEERTIAGERTTSAFGLNPDTAYFRCLVALCEPTLRYPDAAWIPTSTQIADRLYEFGLLGEERDGDWVDRRLDDVRAKLPIGEKAWSAERMRAATAEEVAHAAVREQSGAPRRTARKEQLAEFAVANGIVTLEMVRRIFGDTGTL